MIMIKNKFNGAINFNYLCNILIWLGRVSPQDTTQQTSQDVRTGIARIQFPSQKLEKNRPVRARHHHYQPGDLESDPKQTTHQNQAN